MPNSRFFVKDDLQKEKYTNLPFWMLATITITKKDVYITQSNLLYLAVIKLHVGSTYIFLKIH